MTVRFYQSTDASAPVLRGVAGDLIALLDACLVTGYGAQAAAGWTKPYTGTNKAVFRMGTTGNTGFYLNVEDAAAGSGGAREAYMTGFQTMSAVATGTGQFPTGAQLPLGPALSGACVCRKSATADTTARKWYLLADESVFYLYVETGDYTVNPLCPLAFMFGDIYSVDGTNDLYRCVIIGRNNQNTGVNAQEGMAALVASLSSAQAGHFIAAQANGVGTSVNCGKHVDLVKFAGSGSVVIASGTGNMSSGTNSGYALGSAGGNSGEVYPGQVDGAVHMLPIWINHPNMVRGRLKGIWAATQTAVFNQGDTFNGTGDQTGKTFIAMIVPQLRTDGAITTWANVYLETSNTWS